MNNPFEGQIMYDLEPVQFCQFKAMPDFRKHHRYDRYWGKAMESSKGILDTGIILIKRNRVYEPVVTNKDWRELLGIDKGTVSRFTNYCLENFYLGKKVVVEGNFKAEGRRTGKQYEFTSIESHVKETTTAWFFNPDYAWPGILAPQEVHDFFNRAIVMRRMKGREGLVAVSVGI